ncbi:SwmB domain-containing protein [Moraxella catarrhalis]|uniref:SwmB domain-containing protein n=1 Tax=Moraxella catarrhalis TaxID=480 RepID=UPI000E0384F5|nr:SwmB domain-containing protein [Moraxella catarrhalis]STY79026.1 cyanobacterial long protein repeat [Moraxella catarrhalis]
MSNIVLKTHSTTKTVGQIALTQGVATKVKAQKGVNYELVDQQTGRAPDHIITKRVGKDLHISLDKDGQSDDLIIEDYYDHGDAALIGLAEDGQYYYYIPDTGEAVDYVTQLVTGDVEGQALGGGAVSTPWWIGATETKAAIWPWLTGGLLAAGAVGIVAASVDGVADSLEKDTTFTPKTTDADITITVAGDDVVNKAEADKATVPVAVKVAPKDGETVTGVKVTINNKEYPAEKAANGDYVAQVTPADIKADQDKHADAKVTLSKDGKTGTVTDKEAYTVDTDAPTVKGNPTVDDAGTTLTVPFNEPLDAANPPTKESFTVKVDGKTVQPTKVTVDGDKVKLTLPNAIKQGDTVKVSYKDPSAADDAKAVQDKAGNDAASFTDTDVTNSSTVQDKPNSISSVTLVDNLTDETPNAQNYYPKNTGPYVGNVGNANTAKFDTAVSLKSGLTNDKTPTLNFTLDRAVATDESVEVIRHTMVNGRTARSENVTNKVKQGSDKSYSLTDSLTDTYGTDYKYTVRVKKGNKVVNEKSHAFRLDTTVESMEITKAEFDDRTKSAKISLKSRGNSEVGATVTYKYMSGGREVKGKITDSGNKGVYDLNLQGFDRKDTKGLTLETVDAAGNINTQKINFLRNLFSEYNTEKGVDVTKASIDDNARIGLIMGCATGRQATTTGSNAIKATNGNDTLVVGLEKFGGFGLLNGSVSDEGGVARPRTQDINFGAGDDFLLVRGSLQAFERDSTIKMGTGNDKVQINGSIAGTVGIPKFKLDMGDGDDLLVVKSGVGSTIKSTLLFGNGNDSMFVGGDFNGRKENVDFGNGNNTLNIGRDLINNGSLEQSKINFGKDNDTLVISRNFDNKETTINMGDGDNFVQVGGQIRSGSIISGSGNDTYELGGIGWGGALGQKDQSLNVKTGAGNDIVTIKGHAFRGGIHLEGGDDTLSLNTIQNIDNANRIVFDGGTGRDTLKLTGGKQNYSMDLIRNFEIIDMASTQTKQTLGVTGASLKNNSNKLYIKAGAEDTVNLGDGSDSKVNLKDGNLTWSKDDTKQQTIDGTVYDAYNLATTDQWVYIQQGTTVV